MKERERKQFSAALLHRKSSELMTMLPSIVPGPSVVVVVDFTERHHSREERKKRR